MSHIPKLLHALARLVQYPNESTLPTAELLYVVLQGELPAAAQEAAQFGAYVEQHELSAVEEAYTRAFDVNPMSALEVGWHLFGEEYARGMFLVRMREELRKYAIPESVELPDHLSHVLAIVAAMPEGESQRFVRACVQPAVEKMNQALSPQETPYRHVIGCLASLLTYVWGEPCPTGDPPRTMGSTPFDSDPLRAFPVADVTCGCDVACTGAVELVPLQLKHPSLAAPTTPAILADARKP